MLSMEKASTTFERVQMKNTLRRALALVGVCVVLPFMAVPAKAESSGPLTVEAVAAMTPERQAKVLEPLRLAADAAAQVGQGIRADIYTQVEMASDYRSVNVYLTDVRQGRAFLAAVRRVNPKVNTRLINVVQGKKSRQQLKKEISAITDRADLPFKVGLAGSSVDGGVIELGVDNAEAAHAYLASPAVAQRRAADATEIRVRQAPPSKPLTRWNDTTPFYAGAALGPASGSLSYCTSGIPAVSTWDGRQWLVTAGHCYNVGDNVWAAGGNYIGQVKYKRPDLDSVFIEAPTNRYTWDGLDSAGYSRYLNGVRNVAVGDFTCQLGYNSKVVCNIRTVYAGNASWTVNGTTVWGSYGVPNSGGVVGRGGDSGGPVIYINDTNSRQLNGIVSVGYGCGASGCTTGLGWVDVWSIFNGFAIKLNPS
ncbi:hypothetical protein ACIG87_23090 [Micromonospora sp. NPDC051925]|uniref:hypothetical protein n=1 Tax=Micromonospora sp. NPDC051925 TaxID=3364288 RepID=UPI0037CC354D